MRSSTTLAISLTAFAGLAALTGSPARADDPALGATTFTVYDAFMSPAQEPGEESDTPSSSRSSSARPSPPPRAPSSPRAARRGRLPVPVNTVAGMEYLARKGVLDFNLHTKAHTF